ncbi:MAG: hypothetical protein MUF21_11155 [Gemmatimonadaceae bacterium]|nr:hypothetical protein [Gemmatimonadaceae bacterium]
MPSRLRLLVRALVVTGLAATAGRGGALHAQQPARSVADTAVGRRAADDATIARVTIDRGDIYAPAEARDYWYAALGNWLHLRTREHVIRRELLLRAGAPMDSARAAETARNLRRLGIFAEVRTDTVRAPDGRLELRVHTEDGWSTRPVLGFRSVGGQTLISAGVIETNVLGLGGTLDVRWIDDPDRTTLRTELVLPRVIRDRITVGAGYNRFSDGRSGGVVVEQPWFSLSTRGAWRVQHVQVDGRVLRFRDGTLRIVDSLTRRLELTTVEAGRALRASPAGFVRVGATAQLRREDFAPRESLVTTRTMTAAVTPFVEALRARFVVVRNYRLLGPQEDVDLSSAARVGVAIAPRAWGYATSGAGPLVVARSGARLPRGFALATVRGTGLASGGAVDSGTVTVAGTLVLQPDARQTLVAYANAGWERNPWPGEEFDLGLVRGPRAFPLHAFTGDRQRFAMVEYKYALPYRVARTLVVAVAGFAEVGGAWFAGDPSRYGADAGAGVRIGSTRTAQAFGAVRVDVARRFATDRFPAGWVTVIGTGFPFDLLR